MQFRLAINGSNSQVVAREQLLAIISTIQGKRFTELHMSAEKGNSLSLLSNGDTAWLMYLRFQGDTGYRSYNSAHAGPADVKTVFVLSNGQRDEYPLSWCIPVREACKALEEFFETGSRPASISWQDDSSRHGT